jgi:hypothetical protein
MSIEKFRSLLEAERSLNEEMISKEIEKIQELINESKVELNDIFMDVTISVGKLVQELNKKKLKKEAKEALDCLKKMSKSLEKAGGPSVY